jgi:hypothetical protein
LTDPLQEVFAKKIELAIKNPKTLREVDEGHLAIGWRRTRSRCCEARDRGTEDSSERPKGLRGRFVGIIIVTHY